MKPSIEQSRVGTGQRVALRWPQVVRSAWFFVCVSCLPAAALTHYVDDTSDCDIGVGVENCVSCDPAGTCGPIKNVNAAVQLVPTLHLGDFMIKAGFYPEPVVMTNAMVIRAYGGPAVIGDLNPAPFDLVWDSVDDNGLPLNPQWGSQITNPSLLADPKLCNSYFAQDAGHYPCTHQSTSRDFGNFNCGPHVNWFGVTYQGTNVWNAQSCPGCDDDYQMFLRTVNGGGYTANDARDEIGGVNAIECEFDSDETVDHFDSPWWSLFHQAVDDDGCLCCTDGCINQGPYPHGHYAKQMMNGANGVFVIVTGLMGLDCAHSCQDELHPVWALAMNVPSSTDDELWVFFVRNWGNEGYCGTGQHFLDLPNNKYTFRLPWKAGAASVSYTKTFHPYNNANPEPTVQAASGQGVLVTFTLDSPRANGSMWDGELHLQWVMQ